MEFVQSQYDKYDQLGRKLLVDFLVHHGWTVEPKEKEDYKIDTVIMMIIMMTTWMFMMLIFQIWPKVKNIHLL